MSMSYAMLNGWLSLFLVLTGPFLGSFISASAQSWPDRSNMALSSRSHCAACGRQLTLIDLLPLLSFLWLRGKCRTCKAPIAGQHFVAELASTFVALSAVIIFDDWLMLASALFGYVLLFIALVDYRTRLIPDGASFSLILSGPAVLYALYGPAGLKSAILGAVFGYGIFWLVAFTYKQVRGRDGLGMGDAKLLAGGGAWMGAFALPWIILLASSSALVLLLISSKGKTLHRETELPFGPALALAIYGLWLWVGAHSPGFILL